jgi:aryl-alcohol dehydrogenase-like predicted oxidoreductase
MEYTQLGNSGLTVSRMALGTMTFGQYGFAGFHANVDQEIADRMVALALDAGVNLFDTAEGYGNGRSEEVLGAALRRANARDRAVVATKVSTFTPGDDPDAVRLSYRHVVGNAELALRRLGTDWIDLYQLHQPDFVTPWEETLRALDDLVTRGLVRYVGWSNHPAWHAARGQGIQQLRGYAPFVSGQIYYSLIGRDAEHEILPYCRAAGIGTLIWSPLAGGFLSGKYTREDPAGEGGRRAAFSVPPVDLERGYDAVETMRAIADERGVPVAHIAYAWLLARPGISSVIIGASRPEQLADNLAAADLLLTENELAALDAVDPPAPIYPDPRWLTPAPPPAAQTGQARPAADDTQPRRETQLQPTSA